MLLMKTKKEINNKLLYLLPKIVICSQLLGLGTKIPKIIQFMSNHSMLNPYLVHNNLIKENKMYLLLSEKWIQKLLELVKNPVFPLVQLNL